MTSRNLANVSASELAQKCQRTDPVSPETLGKAAVIVADVRKRGDEALREYSVKFGDLKEGEALVVNKEGLKAAYEGLDEE